MSGFDPAAFPLVVKGRRYEDFARRAQIELPNE